MYTTIRSYGGGDAFTDALVEKEEAIRAVITPIAGFRGYYLVRGSDGPTTISVYEDQAGADESVRAAAAWSGRTLPTFRPVRRPSPRARSFSASSPKTAQS